MVVNLKTVLPIILLSGLGVALSNVDAAAQDTAVQEAETSYESIDWLNVSNGAVMISATSEYDSGSNGAVAAISGSRRFTWYTEEGDAGPQSLIYELAQNVLIDRYVIDATYESADRAPKNGTLWGSTESAEGPWEKIDDFVVDPKKGINNFSIDGNTIPSKWLKFDFADNWGSGQYVAVTELDAYGTPAGEVTYDTELTGVFDTNYSKVRLRTDGSDVVGCYDWQGGTLTGDTDGRILRFQWTEVPEQIGTAVMAISTDKNRLSGFFYEQGRVQGAWSGTRDTSGKGTSCTLKTNVVESALSDNKRAVLYGIRFDYDSDRLKASAVTTLTALGDALKANPNWRIEIQGHTDSDGSDDYNLDLSDRRAASVRQWLVDDGIAAERMTSKGLGESQPASDNSSTQGRALNRRVEILRLD